MAIGGGTWTYGGDPAASTTAQVRFLSGDIDTNDQLISDEEIAWVLTQYANVFIAAAQVCEAIVAAGRLVDKKIGDLSLNSGERAAQMMGLAKSLRRRAGRGVLPYAGGVSISDKQTYTDNSDIPTPSFSQGQHDHPDANLPGDGLYHSNSDDGLTG